MGKKSKTGNQFFAAPALRDSKEKKGATCNSQLLAWVFEWRFPNYGNPAIWRYKTDKRDSDYFMRWWNDPKAKSAAFGQRITPLRAQWLYVLKEKPWGRTLAAEIYVRNSKTWYIKKDPATSLEPVKRFEGCTKGELKPYLCDASKGGIPVEVDTEAKWSFFLSPIQLNQEAIKTLQESTDKNLLIEEDFRLPRTCHSVLVPDPYRWIEDIHFHDFIPAITSWRRWTHGDGLKGEERTAFDIRWAKIAIASGLAGLMGECEDWKTKEILEATDSKLAKKITELPKNKPKDPLKLGGCFNEKLLEWKAPYKCLLEEYWRLDYFYRVLSDKAIDNIWEWIKGAAHRLIDKSVVRTHDHVAKDPEGNELPTGSPLLLAVEHWARIYAYINYSKTGRLFLIATCGKPRNDVCWVEGTAKPGDYFPSVVLSDKRQLYLKLMETPLVVQFFSLVFPTYLAEHGEWEAAQLFHNYYNGLGLGVILKFKKLTGIAGRLSIMFEQAKLEPLEAKLTRTIMLSALLQTLKRQYPPPYHHIPTNYEWDEYRKKGIWWQKWKEQIARGKLYNRRSAELKAQIGKYEDTVKLLQGEYRQTSFERDKLIKYNLYKGFSDVMLAANVLIGFASMWDATKKQDDANTGKNFAEIVGSILDRISRLKNIQGPQIALKSVTKVFNLVGAGLTCYIEGRDAENSIKVGGMSEAIGHGIAAGGATFAMFAAIIEIEGLLIGEAAAASVVAGPIALIALAIGLIGTLIAAFYKQKPYEIFAKHCFLGSQYENDKYAKGKTDWSLGEFETWWPRGNNGSNLDALKKQLRVLNYLNSNYLVVSNKYKEEIKISIHPGILEKSSKFEIMIRGNIKGYTEYFKFTYLVWPMIKQWKAYCETEYKYPNIKPGKCYIDDKDRSIWINLPFNEKDIKQARAEITLYLSDPLVKKEKDKNPPTGGQTMEIQNPPPIKCKHEIHYGGSASEIKERKTYSLND